MTFRKYILFVLSGLLAAGCAGDSKEMTEQSRLPLVLEPSLSCDRLVTRAVGSQFEADDELLCYVRHLDNAGDNVQARMVTLINGVPTQPL